jgi:hypothetical protein
MYAGKPVETKPRGELTVAKTAAPIGAMLAGNNNDKKTTRTKRNPKNSLPTQEGSPTKQ